MWTRRQQFFSVSVVVLLLLFLTTFKSPRTLNYASRISPQISWPLVKSSTPSKSKHFQFDVTEITETTLPGGAPANGFTIFDRLYVWNGTVYVVTSEPSRHPELWQVLSKGLNMDAPVDLKPTDLEMQVITPEDAKKILGDRAIMMKGMTMILYDTGQFMKHYYHWWGELILGAMRMYSSLELIPGMKLPLIEPTRFLLPNTGDREWRDRAQLDGPLMRAGFPHASIETQSFWDDIHGLGSVYVFERAMIVSRVAAHRDSMSAKWNKMIAPTMKVPVPDHFWEPLRQRLVGNVLGYIPELGKAGLVVTAPKSRAPIVTYVSRQAGGRRLEEEDDAKLVAGLNELEAEGLCELHVAHMERMPFISQIELASKTTIMLGVHGNGLTHQLWMPPSARSTVIEIYYPGTYNHDYQILATNMGHQHYAVWNDTVFEYGDKKEFDGVEGGTGGNFNGNHIYVHGPAIAQKVREVLTMSVP